MVLKTNPMIKSTAVYYCWFLCLCLFLFCCVFLFVFLSLSLVWLCQRVKMQSFQRQWLDNDNGAVIEFDRMVSQIKKSCSRQGGHRVPEALFSQGFCVVLPDLQRDGCIRKATQIHTNQSTHQQIQIHLVETTMCPEVFQSSSVI